MKDKSDAVSFEKPNLTRVKNTHRILVLGGHRINAQAYLDGADWHDTPLAIRTPGTVLRAQEIFTVVNQ